MSVNLRPDLSLTEQYIFMIRGQEVTDCDRFPLSVASHIGAVEMLGRITL